jgi:iron complex transport system permease protein
LERTNRNAIIVIGLGILLAVMIIISFQLGRYPINPKEVLGISLSKLFPIERFWTDRVEIVLINIRLPRIILACLVGCCLSAAGAAYQGVFQNPMAAPDILGASAGAAFGAALAIHNYGSSLMIMVSAFFFSLLTVTIVYLISKKVKGNSILGLILSGIIVGSLFSAGTSYIKLVADPNDQLPAITYWLMGSLAGAKLSDVKFVVIPMAIGLIPLLLLRWRMNILTMGDDEARTMGVNAHLIRFVVIISSTLTTAASVSVSGMIGWVGLVIPHLARKIVGNNYSYLIPASVLCGAIFLLLVDNVSRNFFTTEIPLGILTAVIGAPFFIYLITRKGDDF